MIKVQKSKTHGNGVFAEVSIQRQALIGIYEGRRYSLGADIPTRHDRLTYLFALSDGATIDGAEGGNDTRFINHSCQPNCVAIEAYDDSSTLVVEIRAKRRIRVGEELFLDYALVVFEELQDEYRCLCNESACRGTMTLRNQLSAEAVGLDG